jgi:Na+/proline symporter
MQSTVILIYLAVTLGIGLFAARRVRTLADYVLAGRNLPLWLVMPTMFALWFGAETVMGSSYAIAAQGIGSDVLVDPVGAALCLVLYGLFFAGPLYKTGNLTIVDFFRDRFGMESSVVAACISAPTYLFWVAAQLLALGFILDRIAGFGLLPSMVLGSLVIVVYTWRGGMWAITITEFIEMLVIVTCLIAVLAVASADSPTGLVAALEAFADEGKLNVFSALSSDPAISSTGIPLLGAFEFAALLLAVGAGSLPSQDVYERVNSGRSERIGVWGAVGGGLIYLVIACLPLALGVLAAADLGTESVESLGESLILELVDRHGGVMTIAFYAALISAVLSTASAAILAPSVLIGLNVGRPLKPAMSDRELLRMTRRIVLGFTLIAFLIGCTGESIHDLVEISSTLSLVSLAVPLTAGIYWRRARPAGAIAAMIGGLGVYFAFAALSIWQGSAAQAGFTEWAGVAWLVDVGFGHDWLFPTSMLGLAASACCMVAFSTARGATQDAIMRVAERFWRSTVHRFGR